jgi:hypothetical protein
VPLPNRPPLDEDALWRLLQQLTARLRQLESRRTTAIGSSWVLEERDGDQALVARNTRTGRVVEVALPE